MDTQLTFRLPRDVARALARRARERRVPRSHVVREALEAYLAVPAPGPSPLLVRERIAPFVGAVRLDPAAFERDAIMREIRRRNWRP